MHHCLEREREREGGGGGERERERDREREKGGRMRDRLLDASWWMVASYMAKLVNKGSSL